MNIRNAKYILRGEMRRNYSMAQISDDPLIKQGCRDVGNAIKVALELMEQEGARHGKSKRTNA